MKSLQGRGTGRLTVLALAACLAAGCGVAAVDRLQGEYTRLFLALQSAESARDRTDRQSGAEQGIRLQLAEVAADARTAAVQAKDARTAIHLYLIAALSAWQAGPEGEALLVDVAGEGARACDAMKGQATRPPRDCAQLSVVPALAINDILVERLVRLKQLPASAEARKRSEAATLTDKTRQNLDRLLARRETLAADPAISTSYRDYVEGQLYILYCNHAEAATQLSLTQPGRDEGREAVERAIRTLKPQLAAGYRDRTCTEFKD